MSKRYKVWLGMKLVGEFRMPSRLSKNGSELHDRVAVVIAGELAVAALREHKTDNQNEIIVTVDEE